jgi:hypothetical protein
VPKIASTQQAAPKKVAYGKERKQTWVSDLRKDLTSDVGSRRQKKGANIAKYGVAGADTVEETPAATDASSST